MNSVVVHKPPDVRIEQVPDPQVGPKHVLVSVKACGICGTDIHIIDGEFPPTTYPIIIGHEFGGECYFCQRGQGNLCERWNAVGVGSHPGGFAECVAVPERCVYVLPDDVDFKGAALIEPVSCVVHGFHLLQPRVGDSYAIYGAGPMGLQNAQIARFNGARVVAIIDINPARLEIARQLGFDVVGASLADVRHVAPRGFDNVIEATGRTKVAEMAIDAVIPRGTFLQFGVCPPGEKAAFDMFRIYNQEITIIGSMAVLNSYGPALDVIAAGAVDVDKMVTHTLPLDRFDEAVALVRRGEGLKIQIAPSA